MVNRLLAYLPRGNTLDDVVWRRRHLLLQWVLLLHLPGLLLFGLGAGRGLVYTLWVVSPIPLCLAGSLVTRHRRFAEICATGGLTYCSAALVALSGGSIEAHFHFFVMIGFIALYQDWVPFIWNVVFTVLSHGIGSVWRTNLIFNHPAGQASPWVWSGIHGLAVLAACVGVVLFWRTTEDEQQKTLALRAKLADAEIGRRKFTSDMLVNLARRNQSLLYRQLSVINQLEEQEKDPDALADLFRLDHLATRIRRNAESLLVLSGEEPPRTWSNPVLLVDVVRAAIAETEDLDRVAFDVDERLAVSGKAVADLTHLLAELVENAVHFSPPQARVIIRTRPYLQTPGAQVLSVEDWGVGLRPEDQDSANELLANPPEVDLSVSQRLGLHVVARLANRHGISISLTPTPGCGVTAVVVLPPPLFSEEPVTPDGQPDGQPLPSMATARPVKTAIGVGSVAPSVVLAQPAENSFLANGFSANDPSTDDLSRNGFSRYGFPGSRSAANSSSGPGAFSDDPTDPNWPGWFPAAEDASSTPSSGRAMDAARLDEFPLRPRAAAPQRGPSATTSPAAPVVPQAPPPPVVPQAPPRSAVPQGPPVPQAPGPPLSQGPPPPASAGEAQLSRRVPQAHLAPELRRRTATAASDHADPAAPPPDAVQARNALSRYQASRRAARALVEGTADEGDDRSGPGPGGDWA